MNEREEFEGWTRKFYSDLACASDTWSDEKGTYTDYTHHMAWHLWQELQSRLEDLEQEMQEQCRIIGWGTERELRMLAQMEQLDKEKSKYQKALAYTRSYGSDSWSEWLISEVDDALCSATTKSNKETNA